MQLDRLVATQTDAAATGCDQLQLRPTSCNYTRTGCILSELQAGRVQLQPGQSELQLVHVQLQLVHTQLQSVPSNCNWSIHLVAIDVFSRLQLQGGRILYRECTLLHFSLAVTTFLLLNICLVISVQKIFV